MLAALRREPGIHRLSLSGLDDAELTQFVVAAAGYDLGEAGLPFVQALYRETDGNPFFAWEVMQHLAESGAAARADDGTWSASIDEIGLPDSIREVVGRRVVRLGPDAERVLGLAAVIGTEWDLDLLAAAIHQPSDDLLDLLERAERAGLVRSAGPDRFGWAHTLIQHTLSGGLTAARRARAHRQVAEAIESVGTGGRSAELARHWAAAVAPAEAGKAVEYARQAGDEALAALAPDAAVRLYRQALELLAQQSSADDALRCELLCSLAEAQRQAGDGAFQDTRNAAARLARHLGDTDRLVRAVLTDYQRGYPANDPERVAHLEAALAAVGPADTDERGRLLGSLAFELSFTDPDRSAALWDESRAVALRVADLRALGQARRQMAGWVGFRAAWLDAGRKWQVEDHELAAAAEQLGDPDTIFDVAYAQYFNAEMSGDPAMRDDAYRRLRSVADELRRPDYRWIALYVEADMSLDRGDAARAERLVEEAFTIGRDTAQWGALTIYAAGLNNVRWFQGRRHEAASVVERAGRGDPALSLLHLETEAGGHALSEVVTRLPRDGAWLPAITVLAESAARRQDTQAARLIYEELLPHAHLFANATGIHRGSVALYLGMLATTMARYDEADRHFTAALAGEERLGAPFRVARTQLEWGRMLAAQGDAAGARQRLQAARDLAQRYGCAQVERRAERLLAGDAFKPD